MFIPLIPFIPFILVIPHPRHPSPSSSLTLFIPQKLGFAALPNVTTAIGHIAGLRGIGPATASAVLASSAAGGRAPFMADEAMEVGSSPISVCFSLFTSRSRSYLILT